MIYKFTKSEPRWINFENSKGEKLLKKLDNHFLKVYNSDVT